MASDLAALIARLKEAKEGSRELDCDVYEAVDPNFPKGVATRIEIAPAQPVFATGGYTYAVAPPVTTDLSAAVALCERALPGWHWSIRKKSTNPDFFEGLVTQAAWSYAVDRFKVSHDCATLALCLAILRAKAATHE